MSNESKEKALPTVSYLAYNNAGGAGLVPYLTEEKAVRNTNVVNQEDHDYPEELVRRKDVEALFRPQEHARRIENLSRKLQAAATNPFDKEEVLTVAKKLKDIADEQGDLLDEVGA